MKEPFLYFEVPLIKKYISLYGKGLLGNDYELLIAIFLRSFFKSINKIEYKVGFRLQDKYVRYYQKNTDKVNIDSFKIFIENHKEENLDSDFALLPFDSKIHNPIILQAKRFGRFQQDNSTESFISFLKKINSKYVKTQTILVIFFDGHKGMNILEAHNLLKTLSFPFERVLFINPDHDENNIFKIYIGELFPTFGYNEYDPKDLID